MPIRPGNDYWYTVTEAAQYIKRTRQSVWNWINRGIIPEEDIQRLESGAGSRNAIILIREAALINAIRQMTRPKASHGPSKTPRTKEDPTQPMTEEQQREALEMMQEWLNEDPQGDRATWEKIEKGLKESPFSLRQADSDRIWER